MVTAILCSVSFFASAILIKQYKLGEVEKPTEFEPASQAEITIDNSDEKKIDDSNV